MVLYIYLVLLVMQYFSRSAGYVSCWSTSKLLVIHQKLLRTLVPMSRPALYEQQCFTTLLERPSPVGFIDMDFRLLVARKLFPIIFTFSLHLWDDAWTNDKHVELLAVATVSCTSQLNLIISKYDPDGWRWFSCSGSIFHLRLSMWNDEDYNRDWL